MLCMELAHLRNLAQTELRLRRDLVEDLLAGTDDDSALSRSHAVGHDLRPPHQVLVIKWPGARTEDDLVRVAEQTALKVLPTGVLIARRPGGLVLRWTPTSTFRPTPSSRGRCSGRSRNGPAPPSNGRTSPPRASWPT
jgi:hypothetical protein